ncbi:MAG: vWA domain-containing protein [Pseudomonadota bacterium]
MGAIQFDTPHGFLLWPLLILLALLWRWWGGRGEPSALACGARRAERLYHPLAPLLQRTATFTPPLPLWRRFAFWGALSALVVALAGPVRIGKQLPEPPQQRDVLFIVDVSVGMLLRDYRIEGERVRRITLLKQVLDRLVQDLPEDRIGVVVFARSAHTLVPLTDDHTLVRRMLARLDTDIVGRSSSLGEALATAVREAGRNPSDEQPILMLFSDARQPTGRIAPLAAAELAAEAGLVLHTVAIGATAESGPDEAGMIHHPADLKLMAELAARTGATSHHAASGESLQRAVKAITASDGREQEVAPRYERLPLYPWPLGLAMALLLLARLNLSTKRAG